MVRATVPADVSAPWTTSTSGMRYGGFHQCVPILRDKVAAGDLGMKTGRGFRTWTEAEASAAHARLAEHLVAALAARPPDTA